jgi:DNA (cytosine-5)-methyltransferase 1
MSKKIKLLDLFAGAGGFGLGFHTASEKYKLVCSLEVDKWAAETLQANNTENQKIIQQDIREFNTAQKIKSACSEKPDIIIGGPPCQGFSLAGGTKDVKDPRNSLFKNYAQWVNVLKPNIFVMENVRGILTSKNEKGEKVIDIIKSTFEQIGYTVIVWELNAANYGVPQSRERIFVVGSKTGITIPPPPISHYLPEQKKKLNGSAKDLREAINVATAIGDLPVLKAGEGKEEVPYNQASLTDYQAQIRGGIQVIHNHVTMSHTKRIVKRYEEILKGNSLEDVADELKVRKRNGNGAMSETEYNSNYRHLKPDMISYTIPA